MADLFPLLGTQLFSTSHLSANRGAHFVMVEDAALCARLPFHQQKLAFVIGAMRDHRDTLRAAGFVVHYYDLDADTDLRAAVADTATRVGATRLLRFATDEGGAARTLDTLADTLGIKVAEQPSPMFLTNDDVLDDFFRCQSPAMSVFYKERRRQLDLLMDGAEPLGGRWSFDADNRKRVPRNKVLPNAACAAPTANARAAIEAVRKRFPGHPGRADGLWLPTSREGAEAWLQRFLSERLVGFGTYEDAITARSHVVNHSVLSPLMNIGLLTPSEVIEATLDHVAPLNVPLNDLEGFLRQIIGWREFIRGVYRRYGASMRTRNVWNAQRRLAPSWLTAETGIVPLDHALKGAIEYGWNHHIERLMVIANLMNLCEIEPGEVYEFFMTRYVDAYDWVMVPNVFGMGLTSEGGIFATKPYICGANYLRKMSDHSPGPWCDVVDGLFWRFVQKHSDSLALNPRLSVLVSGAHRLEPMRKKRILRAAETFLEAHTR